MKKCVFTFDDGLETHLDLAAPLLRSHNFGATFFVTAARGIWLSFEPEVREKELEWDQVAEIHKMGFEIGNHSWSHPPNPPIEDIQKLSTFLMERHGILTRSFCYPAYWHSEELLNALKQHGYKYARKGYREIECDNGISHDDVKLRKKTSYYTSKTDPMLIYCTGLFGQEFQYNFDQFRSDLDNTPDKGYPVFAFHGLRGLGREKYFEKCVGHLHSEGWEIIALRDLPEFTLEV